MGQWLADLRISILLTLLLVLLCCVAYPALVWGIARAAFPEKAGGSFILVNGRIAGSRLIGQAFSTPAYFHPRPSAAGSGYDATASGGTNLGPLAKKLIEDVRQRILDYRKENGLPLDAAVPADAVTASASGLDPDISLANARLQTGRVARSRGISTDQALLEIAQCTRGRDLGLFGEERVNVLELNLALDRKFGKDGSGPAVKGGNP